jgi:DNA-binding NtrC family response regulator
MHGPDHPAAPAPPFSGGGGRGPRRAAARNCCVQVIGRAADAELRLRSRAISRHHARLVITPEGTRVIDLGSRNGTRVNMELVEGWRQLAAGDCVVIGDATLFVHRGKPLASGISDEDELQLRLSRDLDKSASGTVLLVEHAQGLEERKRLADELESHITARDVIGVTGGGKLAILLTGRSHEAGLLEAHDLSRVVSLISPGAVCRMAQYPAAGRDVAAVLDAARRARPLEPAPPVRRLMLGDKAVTLVEPAMVETYAIIERIAPSDLPVLICGETGTGKELAATALHHLSRRRTGPFVAVNCAALPENLVESELFGHEKGAFTGAAGARIGLIEAAQGGTIFLDEIGELSPAMQAKLLRAIETRRVLRVGDVRERDVDVRVVAATNRNPDTEVEAGRLRRDLLFRLGTVVSLPPLRERPSEIRVLARVLLAAACAREGRPPLRFSTAAMERLAAHRWPGNVRELKNLMDYLAATTLEDEVLPSHFPPKLRAAAQPNATPPPDSFRPIDEEIEELERSRIVAALAAAQGVQINAARLIGMPLRTFVSKLKRYGLLRRHTSERHDAVE